MSSCPLSISRQAGRKLESRRKTKWTARSSVTCHTRFIANAIHLILGAVGSESVLYTCKVSRALVGNPIQATSTLSLTPVESRPLRIVLHLGFWFDDHPHALRVRHPTSKIARALPTLIPAAAESRPRRIVLHLSFCLGLSSTSYRGFHDQKPSTRLDDHLHALRVRHPTSKIARALPPPISAATDSQHRCFVLHLSFCLRSSSTSYRGSHGQRPSARLEDHQHAGSICSRRIAGSFPDPILPYHVERPEPGLQTSTRNAAVPKKT
ncbi:hypothetical protein DFH06DRAFT_1119491 [Mycena polygramma]|nr:hypothetical protein DFH06DRAFT_1119491 [Mycena polygramma]